MSTNKLIVVLGATGKQASWKIRAITRNPDKPSGRALAERGVEVVKADINDVASLTAAFTGAHAIFAVTDFWAPFFDPASQAKLAPGQTLNAYCMDVEVQQAKNIFHAVLPVLDGLERFVFSTLPGGRKWSGGKYQWIYHFDGKQAAVDHLKESLPELAAKTSYVNLGLYLTNELEMPMMMPQKVADGVYAITRVGSADTKYPFVATSQDTGAFVKAAVELPPQSNLLAYSEMASWAEYAKTFQEVTGISLHYQPVTIEQIAAFLPENNVGREAGEVNLFTEELGWHGGDPSMLFLEDLAKLGHPVNTTSLKEWMASQDWSFLKN
ncbi:hypothetical protein BD626DRAFT_568198 [Schizophyllum amplum]|uniref:NmrA-like domain-containing protein n=1 Tax=Schizophyllum amplum TaxID=97359 RepID=A0A550CI09_9AGAR|nr:hypothetical protein BD626DRAFT_568198 [Auriculariopsis ampla]